MPDPVCPECGGPLECWQEPGDKCSDCVARCRAADAVEPQEWDDENDFPQRRGRLGL